GGTVYALPGVPSEMRTIMEEVVLPELAGACGPAPTARRTLRTAGLWESEIAEALAPVEALDGVALAYLPAPAEVRVRVTAAPDRLDDVERRVRELLGPGAVYGVDDETLDRVVHRLLAERSATVAAAESLTGGLIGAELTRMPGSSETFVGGMVTYSTALKEKALGVPADLLARHGAVHPDVAAAMASGVRERLGATYGVAVTGVAGPDPQDGRPVGTVYVGVAGPERPPLVIAPRLPVPGDGARAREAIRAMTVVHALELLRRVLLGLPAQPGADPCGGRAREDREV
ncbi:MAG: nicotinamide-nucleotide amidohydrolase family protein, partial [Actinomadura rubrobrunea]|nr:nicotinamide-nucleotide amidohydrolase family protein [Actinomadura rubrobrunea]